MVADLDSFVWEDGEFLKGRAGFQTGNAPVSVYEMYLGSFVALPRGEASGGYANYREIAAQLIPYIKKMGYTHVELMPVMEHPPGRFLGIPGDRVLCAHQPVWHSG